MHTRAAFALLMVSLPLAAQPHANEKSHEDPSRFPEVEFVASDIFRSGTYIQPLWKELHFEGHYFGGEETDVGYTGASWLWRWRGFGLAPGAGVAFGSNRFVTTPGAAVRWDFEKRWFVTQGLAIYCFRRMPAGGGEHGEEAEADTAEDGRSVRPAISDGNHVSARWRRVTIGGTWEHIHFREGDEWKGGGRLAIRLARHVSAVLYVLGPGRAEFRAGLLIHPALKND